MQLLFLHSIFSEETLRALCWTLIHSLWQGLLAAAVAGIIIACTRKSVARLRYNLLGVVLAFFVTSGIITFYQQLNSDHKTGKPFIEIISVGNDPIITENPEAVPASASNTIDDLVGFLNTNADLFVLIWFAFFLFHCIKLLTGLAGISRLRTHRVCISDKDWQTRIIELSKKLGIQRSVSLFESALIKIPVAIGFLKPVILVPLGLLSNLPAEQAETILLHELAHIRRKDYVMNILQRFAEAVYFFNPALLWISSLLRQEREACCDDIVIANTHHKGSYLEALVSFQEYSLTNSGYAMAISSKKNYLLNRVKRMLTRENKKLNLMEKIFLTAGLVVFTAFTLLPQNEAANKKEIAAIEPVMRLPEPKQTPVTSVTAVTVDKPAVKKEKKQPVYTTLLRKVVTDTVPVKEKTTDLNFSSISSTVNDDGKTKTETTTATDQSGKKYTYTRLNNKVTSLSIDGKNIPEDEIADYSNLFDQIDKARDEHKARRLKSMEQRKIDMANRAADLKNRNIRQKLQREYQDRQRKYNLEQSRKLKEYERSRRAFESEKRKRINEYQKLRQKYRPTLNGREIIRKDIRVDNSAITEINTKNDINVQSAGQLQNATLNVNSEKALPVKPQPNSTSIRKRVTT